MDMKKRNSNPDRNNISDFIVNITAALDGSIEGKIEHCQSGAVKHFKSCMEMFLLIRDKLDDVRFPQSSYEIRSWVGDTIPCITKEVETYERKRKG